MPLTGCEPTATLQDVVARLAALEQQIAELSAQVDDRSAELRERLEALQAVAERERPPFPMTAEQWEGQLPDLFGGLLPPPLVPVCARLLIGMRAKQIAAELGRPPTTVKSQIVAIRERFGVDSSDEIPLHVFRQFWDALSSSSRTVSKRGPKGR